MGQWATLGGNEPEVGLGLHSPYPALQSLIFGYLETFAPRETLCIAPGESISIAFQETVHFLWESIHCSLHKLFRACLGWAVQSDLQITLEQSPSCFLAKINQALGSSEWAVVSDRHCVCVRSEG